MGREQAVCVNGHFSKFLLVISGVPQGSVLGPLIFLIMIGDIDKDILNSLVSSFANDSCTLKQIKMTLILFTTGHRNQMLHSMETNCNY